MSRLITEMNISQYVYGMRAVGMVVDDTRFPDYTTIMTSPIIEIGSDYIVTENSRYEINDSTY